MPTPKNKKSKKPSRTSWNRCVRKARIDEAVKIQKLIEPFAREGEMLPRSLGEIYEHLRDYMVLSPSRSREIIGTCALHIAWSDLAEIRSLAVRREHARQGIGTTLVQAAIREARLLGCRRIFSLTFKPDFFVRLGFTPIEKNDLPQKVWTDCIRCPHFPDCHEEAVVLDIPGK